MKHDVIVIGGGASGMMAAITAARNGAKVLIIDQNDRLGKKILSTGNGKCNYTNENQDICNYHSDNPDIVSDILGQLSLNETLSFFREIGVYPLLKRDCFYPNSETASSVQNALRFEVSRLGISLMLSEKVKQIQKNKDGFQVELDSQTVAGKKIILACGSKASAISGSDGSGYELAKRLGHRIIKPLPALVQLRGKEDFYKSMQGVRLQAGIELYAENELLASDKGEVQFTGYGVSGIPVFQVSRFAARALDKRQKVSLVIDLLPEIPLDDLSLELERRIKREQDSKSKEILATEEIFNGLLNKKIAIVLLKECGIKPSAPISNLSNKEASLLSKKVKAFTIRIVGTNDFRDAQVCSGGISLSEINNTMESKKCADLYFAGEILDVDGCCGGYNLQWAWSSGYVAGKNASN